MTTSTPPGTESRKPVSSDRPSAVPVGLFGLHTKTTRVRSVTAVASAARSKLWSGRSGTCTDRAPATVVRMG